MVKRGRKSVAASVTVLPTASGPRPEPPRELTAEQAATWREVVAGLPPDWFQRAPELLTAYCRHVSTANVVAGLIDRCDPASLSTDEGLKHYRRLLAIEVRESAAIAHLATKMRLTQQARYSAKAASTRTAGSGSGRKPWET